MHRLLLAILPILCLSAQAQTANASSATFGPQWRFLVGTWTSGATAGLGAGICTFQFDLGGHILVRTNHAEIPASGNRPAGTHDDLMVLSPGASEAQAQATYWDNEGHVIEYTAAWSADGATLTFLSKPAPGPQYRIVYEKLDSESLNVSFDIAPPGEAGGFKTYISGCVRRQKP